MTEREQRIFDDVIEGLKEYDWKLEVGSVVESLRTDFPGQIADTGNAQSDYERARDWVESRLKHISVSSLEVIVDHQNRTGDDDHAIVDRIIRYYDGLGDSKELWDALKV